MGRRMVRVAAAVVMSASTLVWNVDVAVAEYSVDQTLSQSDGISNDSFGWSVALSADGDTAIVGAKEADPGGNYNQGSATVFTRSGSTWTEQQTITQSDGGGEILTTLDLRSPCRLTATPPSSARTGPTARS